MRHQGIGLLLIIILLVWPTTSVQAQQGLTPVAGGGEGAYDRAAPTQILGALDRLFGELDATSSQPTPDEVRTVTFRRRILELRLLVDLDSFAYERPGIQGYRNLIDGAYEAVGHYQDLPMIQKALGIDLNPDVVRNRLNEMTDALGPLRDQGTRAAMRDFFAHPRHAPRTTGGGPGLWDIAHVRASDDFDSTGNAALLESGIVHSLQDADLGVIDILDSAQEARFHLIRKRLRSALLLASLFPATSQAAQDVRRPLDDLVAAYGATNDAYTIYVFAKDANVGVDAAADKVRREFENAQAVKNQVVDTHALDTLAIRINGVRDAHRP